MHIENVFNLFSFYFLFQPRLHSMLPSRRHICMNILGTRNCVSVLQIIETCFILLFRICFYVMYIDGSRTHNGSRSFTSRGRQLNKNAKKSFSTAKLPTPTVKEENIIFCGGFNFGEHAWLWIRKVSQYFHEYHGWVLNKNRDSVYTFSVPGIKVKAFRGKFPQTAPVSSCQSINISGLNQSTMSGT